MRELNKNHVKVVFCVGLNKTGTSSLHTAFLKLGLSSYHYSEKRLTPQKLVENLSEARNPEYDAILDVSYVRDEWRRLAVLYPKSKFILTMRELNSWMDSREKHLLWLKAHQPDHPWANETIDRVVWRVKYEKHLNEVQVAFHSIPDRLLILNICAGEGWFRLCQWLDLPLPNEPFPHVNSSASESF